MNKTWKSIHPETIRRSKRSERGGILRFRSGIFSLFLHFSAIACWRVGTWRDCNAYLPDITGELHRAPTKVRRAPAIDCSSPRHAHNAKSPHEAGFFVKHSKNCGYADQNGISSSISSKPPPAGALGRLAPPALPPPAGRPPAAAPRLAPPPPLRSAGARLL